MPDVGLASSFEGAWEPEQTSGINTLSQKELKSQILQVPDLMVGKEILNQKSNSKFFNHFFTSLLPSTLYT